MKLWKISHYIHAAIVSLTISLAAWSCKQDSPSQPETPKGRFIQKVVFTSFEFGAARGALVMMADLYDDNGAFKLFNRKELTEGISASLAYDETWLVYHALGNNWEPMRINIDGSHNQKIPVTEDFIFDGAKISPDGTMLAFSFYNPDQYNGRHLGVVPVTGGVIRTIYADQGWSIYPEWSPDGKKIYFIWPDFKNRYGHNGTPSGRFRIKTYIISINVDGSGWRAISDTVDGLSEDTFPSVSPDGSQIAFVSKRSYPEKIFPEVFVMSIDGTDVRQLTRCLGCQQHEDHTDLYTYDSKPIWTKDGQHILFERQVWTYDHDIKDYTMQEDIYIINIDGSGLQKLTKNGFSSLTKRRVQ